MFDPHGNRKYLTVEERAAFLGAAAKADPTVNTFCTVLAYTGARISEVLALRPGNIDPIAGLIVIQCLKKRGQRVFRAVPVPGSLLTALVQVHALNGEVRRREGGGDRLWRWGRTTAWRRIKEVMATARIVGPCASPKGLRHSFGVAAIQSGVPLNLVRKWMGHARLSTTAIYTDAVGQEEQAIAARFWQSFSH